MGLGRSIAHITSTLLIIFGVIGFFSGLRHSNFSETTGAIFLFILPGLIIRFVLVPYLYSKTAEYWFDKGNVLYGSSNFKEAISCYDKVLEKEPNFELAKRNRELCLSQLK
ncbi:MAG: tetratricopeptide repeat protein [Methanocellales archaeon]|nr:tetratricopeptide repeat protein [Methanocellales archaeon]MDD3292011.1 tetratricopeptide repeat protein [Methanocellales archaeon]MDD5235706.1 tetratricopeptide repeat protein [Methanocellales archaeon]MDD5485632.1 tetratricopeptide repeat protein [Methanocellales archaeon]